MVESRHLHQEPVSVLVARFLPLHAAVFATIAVIKRPESTAGALASISWITGLLVLRYRWARTVALVVCIGVAAFLFPDVPNHGFVLCAALGIGALYRDEVPAEQLALAEGFRQLAAMVIFWSGVQKAWAGTWVQGQLLAYQIGHSRRFANVLGWLVSRAERDAYRTSGPFLGSPLLILLSNAVWLLEIALGIALLSSRQRVQKGAAIVALALIFGIELAARESVFGVLMLALLLPATNVHFRARWLLLLIPIELLAVAGHLSLVPGGFH